MSARSFGIAAIAVLAGLAAMPVISAPYRLPDEQSISLPPGPDAELAEEKKLAHERAAASEVGSSTGGADTIPTWVVAFAWLAVGLPLAWGVYRTLQSVAKFFA